MACATVTNHQRTAVAAYQLACQNEVLVALRSGRRFFVCFHTSLYLVKCLLVDQRRECVFRDNIPVAIFAQIAAIPQHILKATLNKLSAVACSYTTSVHIRAKFLDGIPSGIALEHLSNNGTHHRVWFIVTLLIDAVAQRHGTAIELAFQRIIRMAARYFLRQFSRIILGHPLQHTFQHDALRCVGDRLRCGNHFDIVLG